MMEEYEYNWYYYDLPTTKESAISREDYAKIWRLSDRAVRDDHTDIEKHG